MRRLLALVALVLAAGPVSAQSLTGNFAPFNSWWIHPVSGGLGVNHDGTFVNVDRDGDGGTDVAFSNTQVAAEARTNLRLSPTREFMVGWGGTCGTGGVNFYVWSIPPAPSTQLTLLVNGTCIDRSNGAPVPRFYDTGLCQVVNQGLVCPNLGVSPKRVLYILTGSAIFGEFELVWIDLATGTVAQTNNTGFRSNAGFIHVSPSGTQAFVQHDLGTPGETDYTLVDLCPGSLGLALNAGGFPIANSNEVLRAETTAVSGGDVTVTAFDGGNNVEATFTLTDCCAPPPPVGACCRTDRTCDPNVEATACGAGDTFLQGQDCSACVFPPLREACCFTSGQCTDSEVDLCTDSGGVPSGMGSVCSTTVCPAVDLVVDTMGPATASEGDSITYTLDYRNDGNLASGPLTLQANAPFSTTVESATGGAEVFGSTVRWTLPALAPAASGSVSFTVSINCGISMVQLNRNAVLLQDPINFDQPDANVDTAVSPIPSGPVNVMVASTPAAGPPVPAGELITHVIELDNTIAQTQDGLLLTDADTPTGAGFTIGQGVNFEAVVDEATGVFDVQGSQISWSGSLPPGSTTISFTTRVLACLPPDVDMNELNFGNDLAVRSACDDVLGTALASAPLALERRIMASIEAPGLQPKARIISPVSTYDAQLARPGDLVTVELRIASANGQSSAGATASLDLQNFGATALVAPSDPGASYDPATRIISWNGTVPASGDVVVTFETNLIACRGTATLNGGSAAGCMDLQEQLVVAAVPQPPIDGYLVALGYGAPPVGFAEAQVLSVDPAVGTSFDTQLCLPSEFLTGMGVGPAGDVWVGWLPTFHYNPHTLEIEGFDWRQLPDAGVESLADIAVDPRNGDVFFIGNQSVPPSASRGSIARYVPRTGSLAQVVADDAHSGYDRGVVDGLGNLVVRSTTGVLVGIDRSDWSTQVLDTGETLQARDVDVDANDEYVTVLGSFQPPFPLIELDSDGVDAPALVDANLATTFPVGSAFGWGALAVDPTSNDVFLAPALPGLGVVHRDAVGNSTGADVVVAFQQFGTLGRAEDLHWTQAPEPGARLLAVFALLAVAALGGRRSLTRGGEW